MPRCRDDDRRRAEQVRLRGHSAGLGRSRVRRPRRDTARRSRRRGHSLPGHPTYTFVPTPGDAQGFYSAARDFVAAWKRLGAPLVGAVAFGLLAAAVGAVALARRGRRDLALALAAARRRARGLGRHHRDEPPHRRRRLRLVAALVAPDVRPPRRGHRLRPRVAFGLGLALELLALVTTTVCTWLIGLRATGRRRRGRRGRALRVLAADQPGRVGPGAWQNGSWHVDVGLHLYDEPISTALVAAAVVILLAPRLERLPLTAAGILLSFSVAVRLSNAVVAALALGVVASTGSAPAGAAPRAGLATFVPVVARLVAARLRGALRPPALARHLFAFSHVVPAWTDSLLFTPRALAILLPLAAIGVLAIRTGWARALVAGMVVVTAVFYSFYALTPLHPRFLYVAFPELFTLWAGGAVRRDVRTQPGRKASARPA